MAAGTAYGEEGFDDEDDLFSGEQLALSDDDERLPWLETGDYDAEESGWDSGRLLGFAFLALLVLAAVTASYWWYSSREAGGGLQPAGTTIAAPKGPYKVRPADPGGKTFEGTGDTSFAVGEGQSREGRLAAKPAATPTPEVSPVEAPSTEPAPQASSVGVQVGAYASSAAAQAGWQTLLRQTDKLNGVGHRIVEGQADIGKVYRLQAITGDLASAKGLCAALKADGVACTVKR